MAKAVIFDLDGVISDTQKIHAAVEAELLAENGVVITPEEITRRFAGMSLKQQFDELLLPWGVSYDIDELERRRWVRMERAVLNGVDSIDGSVELINTLDREGFVLGVGSASTYRYVVSVLEQLSILNNFHSLVGGDMVDRGKPAPDIFLKAAHAMGVEPDECVVIEDGRAGMLAAAAAGMPCIALVSRKSTEYPTDYQVRSLRGITPEFIRSL